MKSVVIFIALLLTSSPSFAQATGPAGHWEGAVSAPMGEVGIEVDLDLNDAGVLVGMFGNPGQKLKGLPLSSVTVDGRSVRFAFVADNNGDFNGTLNADGTFLSGTFTTLGLSMPFHLSRMGDARGVTAPRSPRIAKELEGVWRGTLDVNGKPMRLVLTMTNHADGTATGGVVSVDQSDRQIPLAIVQSASNVTLNIESVGGVYTGVVNADGTEMTGAYSVQGAVFPLTFRR